MGCFVYRWHSSKMGMPGDNHLLHVPPSIVTHKIRRTTPAHGYGIRTRKELCVYSVCIRLGQGLWTNHLIISVKSVEIDSNQPCSKWRKGRKFRLYCSFNLIERHSFGAFFIKFDRTGGDKIFDKNTMEINVRIKRIYIFIYYVYDAIIHDTFCKR